VDQEKMPMGQLFDMVRQLVAEEKYLVGQHTSERLEERGIMEWQAVAGLENGILLAERPEMSPNRRGARIVARRYRIQSCLVSLTPE
jgi:hypothetical protein